jgi:hypothetical protein
MERRLNLSDDERAAVRRFRDKTAFVGVVDFYPGPRGGRYRSIRTTVYSVEVGVERELARITGRTYNVSVRQTRLVLVNALGEVLAEDVLAA